MRTLTCDVCGSVIERPIKGRNYWNFKTWDICEACKDKMDLKLRPIVRSHFPYDVAWYQRLVDACIEEGVNKGRF